MKPIHAEAIECFQSLGLGEIGGISLVDIGALTIWLQGGATAINPATLANKGLQTYLRGLGSPCLLIINICRDLLTSNVIHTTYRVFFTLGLP